jgi:prepilin-type N-terminal cleavage/methylation domain-containing protein
MDRQRQKGFSLVELAVVLVVAGLILAIGAPGLHKYLESNRVGDAARQISSELRIARQKAVTNGTRNWYFAGISGQEGLYWTGVQTPLPTGGWSTTAWTLWNMPTNTKQVTPNFGGVNWLYYGPDGRANTSGSVKVASVVAAVHDTSQINVDLTGEVWQ